MKPDKNIDVVCPTWYETSFINRVENCAQFLASYGFVTNCMYKVIKQRIDEWKEKTEVLADGDLFKNKKTASTGGSGSGSKNKTGDSGSMEKNSKLFK